jgi:hypothetical protein
MIVAQTLTDRDDDDPSQAGPLLDQIDGRLTQVMADGAYDGAPTDQTIAVRGEHIEVVIPPRSTAVPSARAHGSQTFARWAAWGQTRTFGGLDDIFQLERARRLRGRRSEVRMTGKSWSGKRRLCVPR